MTAVHEAPVRQEVPPIASTPAASPQVAIVHDYLTQRGGAERVVLVMGRAFPGASIHTSVYEPDGTYPDFAGYDVRAGVLNRSRTIRQHHRAGLPFYAPTFSATKVDAEVVVCSSSGWAHGVRTDGAKLVYCHTPARWLYADYLGAEPKLGARSLALQALKRPLLRWDKAAARTVDRYLANSSVTRDRIKHAYGIDAEILPPPPGLTPGVEEQLDGLDAGFHLVVSRLLPYKHIDAVVEAFASMPQERLVVVGEGPEIVHLKRLAGPNVSFHGRVPDEQLRWAYRNARTVICAAHEDFGLVPLEANAHGTPAVALRAGGFLDTIVEGTTGCFFDEPTPTAIREAVLRVEHAGWTAEDLMAHAGFFDEAAFTRRLRSVVADLAS